jgi:hypothetical protein
MKRGAVVVDVATKLSGQVMRKLAFFLKNNVMIQFLHKLAVF